MASRSSSSGTGEKTKTRERGRERAGKVISPEASANTCFIYLFTYFFYFSFLYMTHPPFQKRLLGFSHLGRGTLITSVPYSFKNPAPIFTSTPPLPPMTPPRRPFCVAASDPFGRPLKYTCQSRFLKVCLSLHSETMYVDARGIARSNIRLLDTFLK